MPKIILATLVNVVVEVESQHGVGGVVECTEMPLLPWPLTPILSSSLCYRGRKSNGTLPEDFARGSNGTRR